MAELSEEEQIEALKRWWAENGRSTVIAVVTALAIVFGYQGWQNHEREQGEAASALYQNLLDALQVQSPIDKPADDKVKTAKFLAQQLKDDYSGTTYATFAAFYMARLAVDDKDLKAAEQELQWALDHGVDDSLKPLAHIRMARVRLGLGKPEDALRALEGVEPGAMRPTYEEVKGDIYFSMGDKEKAKEAYQRAVNGLAEGENRPALQMKLDDLKTAENVAPADAAAASDAPAAEAPATDTSKSSTDGTK